MSKPGLALLIAEKAGARAKDDYPQYDDDKYEEELEVVAEEILAAMGDKDAKGLAEALRSFVEMCY